MAVCGWEFPDAVICGQVKGHNGEHIRWEVVPVLRAGPPTCPQSLFEPIKGSNRCLCGLPRSAHKIEHDGRGAFRFIEGLLDTTTDDDSEVAS